MKTLLHVINLRCFGGVEVLFKHYLLAHNDPGIEHHVLLDRDTIHPEIKPAIYRVAKSVNFVKLGFNWKIPGLYAWRSRYLVKKVKPDAVVLWNCFKPVLPAIEAYSKRIPFIFYDHSTMLLTNSQALLACIVPRLAGCIVLGKAMKRIFDIKYPAATCPVRIVINGAIFESRQHKPKQLKPGEPLHIGIAAHLRPNKGHALLLHSVACIKRRGMNVVLHIAGVGPEEVALKALAAKLALGDSVRFLGFVADMSLFFETIYVKILPSFSENFSLSIIEAMVYGCVTVAPDVNESRYIVTHERGLCLEPRLTLSELGDYDQPTHHLPASVYYPGEDKMDEPRGLHPEDLANAIERLIQDPATFAKMSQASIDYAQQTFDFPRYVNTLNQVLLELLQAYKS